MLSWQTICWNSKDSELSVTAEVITGDGFTDPSVAMSGCLNFYRFASRNW